MNSFRIILFLNLLLFMTGACQIDYDLAGGEDDESQPDILMEGITQIQKDDKGRAVLKADEAAFFTSRGETVFQNMEFLDYGNEDFLLRKGFAGKAILYENSDARLSEGVSIESLEDELKISGTLFDWDNTRLQLSSPSGNSVSLKQKGEKEIEGFHFTADFNLNEISFEESVKGIVVIDE